ncbi:hypothetical protein BH23PLA1_BH23PLA1_33930 [soil metagenome]
MTMAPKPEGASTIFVMGLLSLLVCGLLGPIAWVDGNRYLRECRERGIEPEGSAVAGRVMGIIAVILTVIGLLVALIAIAFVIVYAMADLNPPGM